MSNQNRFKTGDTVKTKYGTGEIIGIDLPEHERWRWIIKLTDAIPHPVMKTWPENGEELCFFDHEVENDS